MKHIKLFESFGSSHPIITATGDWSKLTKGGVPVDWLLANTYVVTYYTNPTPEMAKIAPLYNMELNPQEAVGEIMGGDQNGSNLIQRGGMVKFPADPSYSPEDYKKQIQNEIDRINEDPGTFEEDMCQTLLEDPEAIPGLKLTPEFLSHCKAVVAGSGTSQTYINKFPEYYGKHPEIMSGGDRSGLAIMKPRIELVFKVV